MPDSTAAIRSWAKNNGHHVAERGRLSVEVREAYAKAQKSNRPSKAPASKSNAPAKPRQAPSKRAASKPTAAILDVPTPVTTPTRALSEPVAETSVTDPLAVRVATLEQQLKELTSRLAEVETKKRPLGRRRSA
jgi:hypothetical protein